MGETNLLFEERKGKKHKPTFSLCFDCGKGGKHKENLEEEDLVSCTLRKSQN